uniref:Proline iminopeptidase n=1 Tax=Talaromyces marneffei PM1 TaxID=1077442 RepID=A0A093V5T2_TALMA
MTTQGYTHDPAFDKGYLSVGSIHKLHYEQYGNPNGKPVIFLHGGPGGNTSPSNAAYFNPTIYRVVLYDQRGAGQSLPTACIEENTTHHLIGDIEILRKHLGIAKWFMVFGGSWGATLALLYAQRYPEMVGSMVLRGIFTARQSEIDWTRMPDGGAAKIWPAEYERFLGFLDDDGDERRNLPESYSKYILNVSDDEVARKKRMDAALEWNRWELTIGALTHTPSTYDKLMDEDWVLAHATLEAHYEANGAWLEEGQILKGENMERIRHIPGRYDVVCPPQTAWELHKAWPGSRLFMIPDAGHSPTEPGTWKKLLESHHPKEQNIKEERLWSLAKNMEISRSGNYRKE